MNPIQNRAERVRLSATNTGVPWVGADSASPEADLGNTARSTDGG